MNAKMKEACLAVADCFEAIPECWTKDYLGRNSNGMGVMPCDESATQWCAIGGVHAALKINFDGGVWDALAPVANQLGYHNAAIANNDGGRLVAIKMLRMAGGQS